MSLICLVSGRILLLLLLIHCRPNIYILGWHRESFFINPHNVSNLVPAIAMLHIMCIEA